MPPFVTTLLLAGFICFPVWILFTYRSNSEKLRRLKEGAENYAAGRLENKIFTGGQDAFSEVAQSMNRMAESLKTRMGEIEEERNKVNAIFASMSEGVIAVDAQKKC